MIFNFSKAVEINMVVFKFTRDKITPMETSTFAKLGIEERGDLQRLLRDQIDIIAPDTLVISEEFADWEDSRRRIDLLAIDKDANLVVIELKRTDDGGHMDLQAIRYAAMVSPMTFSQAVRIYGEYLKARGAEGDPEQLLLKFLGWSESHEDQFGQDVRIVLVSAEFSKEITTAVLWLRGKGLSIRCVRIKPYSDNVHTLLDVQQIVPLPEAEEFIIRFNEKQQKSKDAAASIRDYSKFRVTVNGQVSENLPKRRAVLQIVKSIVEAGVSPENLTTRHHLEVSLFQSVRPLTCEQMQAAIEEAGSDVIRYFTADSELIYFDGATYAISNQWGPRSLEAISHMIARCDSVSISCEPMS